MDATSDDGWVAEYHRHLMSLYDKIERVSAETHDVRAAANLLVEINGMKSAIGMIYDTLASKVSEIMDSETLVALESGASIEKKWSKSRKGWKHKDLAQLVAKRLNSMAIDLDTGERTATSEELMEKMLDYVQPSYWRVSALDSIGISADDFCEASEATSSIIVRKAKTK